MRKFNDRQTELTEELLAKMPREERQDLLDNIDSIQFIQNLASPNRKYAFELPRWDDPLLPEQSDDPDITLRQPDPNGRIAVDLTNPLRTADDWISTRLRFPQTGWGNL